MCRVAKIRAEARQIALDVYNANFLKLAGVAEDIARDRAERITRDYLEKLQAENPGGLDSVQDPDMLQAIFTAQKAYACSGEEDLEKALVDLLVDRSGQRDRELKTLVLNEAIAMLPKLSIRQRKSIAVCFLIRHTRYTGALNLGFYYDYLARNLTPFAESLSDNSVDYQHIQSAGAGWISSLSLELGRAFTDDARGFFTRGFTEVDLPPFLDLRDSEVFVPCIRNSQKWQLNVLSKEHVIELGAKKRAPEILDELSRRGIMSYREIQLDLESHIPCMKVIFERWNNNNSVLKFFQLTSVGIAIGHAYWRQAAGTAAAPLGVWL